MVQVFAGIDTSTKLASNDLQNDLRWVVSVVVTLRSFMAGAGCNSSLYSIFDKPTLNRTMTSAIPACHYLPRELDLSPPSWVKNRLPAGEYGAIFGGSMHVKSASCFTVHPGDCGYVHPAVTISSAVDWQAGRLTPGIHRPRIHAPGIRTIRIFSERPEQWSDRLTFDGARFLGFSMERRSLHVYS